MRSSSLQPAGSERGRPKPPEEPRRPLHSGWFAREPELLAGDRERPERLTTCQHNRLTVSSDRGLTRVTCACGVSWLEIPL